MAEQPEQNLADLDCCDRPDDPLSRCEVFINLSQRFIGLLGNEASRASRNDPSREYPFVAMDSRQVFRQLTLARRHLNMGKQPQAGAAPPLLAGNPEISHHPPALLDVGCGIGNVMLLAEQLGFDVYGIEKDPHPYQIACRLFDSRRVQAADIWSYEEYHRFQVIYYFRPFAERGLQLRFEAMIEERLQPGGILIANHKNSEMIGSDPRFTRLDPNLPVWLKGG